MVGLATPAVVALLRFVLELLHNQSLVLVGGDVVEEGRQVSLLCRGHSEDEAVVDSEGSPLCEGGNQLTVFLGDFVLGYHERRKQEIVAGVGLESLGAGRSVARKQSFVVELTGGN